MSVRFRPFLIGCALLAWIGLAGLAMADQDDHDAVREAVTHGKILSLTEILAKIGDRLPGRITGVEVERHGGRWVYELCVIGPKGHVYEVYVDARTADIDRIKER